MSSHNHGGGAFRDVRALPNNASRARLDLGTAEPAEAESSLRACARRVERASTSAERQYAGLAGNRNVT